MPSDFPLQFSLKDEHVEMVEIDDAVQLIGKNSRQLFRLTAGGEPLNSMRSSASSLGEALPDASLQVCAHRPKLHSMRDCRG